MTPGRVNPESVGRRRAPPGETVPATRAGAAEEVSAARAPPRKPRIPRPQAFRKQIGRPSRAQKLDP